MDAPRGSDPAQQRLLSCHRVAAVHAATILYQTHSLSCCLLLRSGCSRLPVHGLGAPQGTVVHEVVAVLGFYLACHLLRCNGAAVDSRCATRTHIFHSGCDRADANGLIAGVRGMRAAHLTGIRHYRVARVEALVRVSHDELGLRCLAMWLSHAWRATLCEGCRLVEGLRCDFVVRLGVGFLLHMEEWAASACDPDRSARLEGAVLVGGDLSLDGVHG